MTYEPKPEPATVLTDRFGFVTFGGDHAGVVDGSPRCVAAVAPGAAARCPFTRAPADTLCAGHRLELDAAMSTPTPLPIAGAHGRDD